MIWVSFFSKKKRWKSEKKQLLEEMDKKIKKMEDIIEQISSKPLEYHINIEKLDIHNPVLENLTFRLDKLDIKELGGALNLGNNFGVRINEKENARGKLIKEK